MLSQNIENVLRHSGLGRGTSRADHDPPPKNVGEHGFTPAEVKDSEKILGQDLILCDIVYEDPKNEDRCINGTVYTNTRKTLPSMLPKLLTPPPPSYKICGIAGKGKGVVALRDIAMG
ncbi:hypothetical protein M422DRAFT_276000 [Sphaerobolus stellatus SS14]|uniref:Uncharacterized protein n=1 Tax=Sphaerobolus stellatus (strain SS14) TaxID=990650 RepID=A0A0C9TNK3_SPHS4|nr:hypothetical protein M422DRAFT_276000 [Sphaerobolus stellatus SS14]